MPTSAVAACALSLRPSRPLAPTGTEGPTWGLHDFDVAAPLGNLLELVRAQAAAYRP